MKGLYKAKIDCGRSGYLHGLFVAEINEVEELIKAGPELYFGEVLGKHSDIVVVVERTDVELVTTDEDFIQKAIEIKLLPLGYNPFDYLPEEEE